MKRLLIGCLGAMALLAVAAVAAIWFLFVRELPVLDSSLSVPPQVELDSTFAMVVTAANNHNTSITLDSIDIDDTFLEGFQLIGVSPKPAATLHILGQRSWEFGTPVSPGASVEVRFDLKAVQEGHFSGDVDVCNPNQDFKTVVADVVVREESPADGDDSTGTEGEERPLDPAAQS